MTQSSSSPYGYLSDKAALTKRLARIEGQVRGLTRMVEDERYCIDILTQLSAIDTALRAVGLHVLNAHVKSCVAEALKSGNATKSEAKTDELLEAVERFSRLK